MQAETAATGIMKTHDFGNSKFYNVECSCGNDDDSITFEIEAEPDTGSIILNHWTVQKTDWWTESVKKRYDIDSIWMQEFDWFWKSLWNGLTTRLRLTRDIWWNGYVKYQSTVIMNRQQTLNYAETLKSAISEIEKYQAYQKLSPATKEALIASREGDCV